MSEPIIVGLATMFVAVGLCYAAFKLTAYLKEKGILPDE